MKREIWILWAWVALMVLVVSMVLTSHAVGAERVVVAGTAITDQVRVANPGDVVLVKSGIYREYVRLDRPGITLRGEGDVVLETGGILVTANDVTVENIHSNKYVGAGARGDVSTAAVRVQADNVTLKNITVTSADGTGIGALGVMSPSWNGVVTYRKNIQIINCTSSGNGRNGICLVGVDGALVKNCRSLSNNTALKYVPADEGGGGKQYLTKNVTFDGGLYANNVGPGLWFDYANENYTIRNIEASGNSGGGRADWNWSGVGIAVEINRVGGLIENNYIHDNTGPGIAFWEVSNVTCRGNKLVNDTISFRAMTNRAPYTLRDLLIENNALNNGAIDAVPAGSPNIIFKTNNLNAPAGPPAGWGATTPPTTIPTTLPATLPTTVPATQPRRVTKVQHVVTYSDGTVEVIP